MRITRSSLKTVMVTLHLRAVLVAAATSPLGAQTPGANVHPGRLIWERSCAACHEGADPRAPSCETIRQLGSDDLLHALTEGVMAIQKSMLGRL